MQKNGGRRKFKVELQDIVIAYRKTKVDLFRSGFPYRLKLCAFEENLERNLCAVYDALTNVDEEILLSWSQGWLLAPKQVEFKEPEDPAILFSSLDNHRRVAIAKLRVIADTPIQFHIVMTWWILKIGEVYEALLSANSYGNRIRRTHDGAVNNMALGTFKHYLPYYRKWRDNGIKEIRDRIRKGKDVITITADFSAFYHRIDPAFLVQQEFWQSFGSGMSLGKAELRYTGIVCKMLKKWAERTPLGIGLPVGYQISAVIANLALACFDRQVEEELSPLYYGRYVDDLIIVLEKHKNICSSKDVWAWIHRRIDGLVPSGDKKTDVIKYVPNLPGFQNSTFEFEKSKTKVFVVDHESGDLMLNTLERQIRSHSSEWQLLSIYPENAESMSSQVLSACQEAGDEADNIRKIDALRLKRAVFSMKVRDYEAYARNLTHSGWNDVRTNFLNLVKRNFMDVKSIFDLHQYIPRILSVVCSSLTGSNDDMISHVVEIVTVISNLTSRNLKDCRITLSGLGEDFDTGKGSGFLRALEQYLVRLMNECLLSSVKNPQVIQAVRTQLAKRCHAWEGTASFVSWHTLFVHDLAHDATRTYFQDCCDGTASVVGELEWARLDEPGFFRKEVSMALAQAENELRRRANLDCNVTKPLIAFAFPTRPFTMFELEMILAAPSVGQDTWPIIQSFISASRGYSAPGELPRRDDSILYQWGHVRGRVTFALVNWKTAPDSFNAAVCGGADPDEIGRFNRLMRVINSILSSPQRIDYVVFPELSIPARWFTLIANKLKNARVSLIAGVEYQQGQGNELLNEVWSSLLCDDIGFPYIRLHKSRKKHPALHEEADVVRLAGKRIARLDILPALICHGDSSQNFIYSILVCSDLTDIELRSRLRGKVDALIVPSWNQDANVFASLVESAAYDIHAYVVECNDRHYGDTRIRVPSRERHERDVVRISGGDADYFVVGTIDIDRLRAFQSHNISPTDAKSSYKPVPRGFKISELRRVLPTEH